MEGYLRLAVLKTLQKAPLAGYSLMQAIEQETGWKPSPGSMYPLLTALVKEELATSRMQGRRRVYALTKHGTAALEHLLEQNRDRLERLASQLRVCSPNHPADKDRRAMLERLSKGEAPFGWLTHDMFEVRRLLLHVAAKNVSESDKRAIRKTIAELAAALRRVG
ncbi:MAG TPA: PadR family transcriptional regulator [Candidatus Binatia bacterium]|nr:PadR family transcriptional regulator [Candidatus Binatia bacterium]